jgi:hypothetical protein
MKRQRKSHIYVIGAGGIASYLVPILVKCMIYYDHLTTITIVDGDKLEKRNLDRQMFSELSIGQNKAKALLGLAFDHAGDEQLLDHYMVDEHYVPDKEYLLKLVTSNPHTDKTSRHLFFCCADNNKARQCVIDAVSHIEDNGHTCIAFIGGNETQSADAYVALPFTTEEPYHPYALFPNLLVDDGQSPLHGAGCTGETAIRDNPQLPIANFKAAHHLLHLFNTWVLPNKDYTITELQLKGYFPNLPVMCFSNEYVMNTKTIKECIDERTRTESADDCCDGGGTTLTVATGARPAFPA